MNPTLSCRDGVEALMDYLEGILPPTVRENLETHVSGCRRCQAFVASYRQTPRILKEATATALPAGLAASLRRFLASRR